jgi:hypothetical protein
LWRDGEAYFNFGKHRYHKLADVVKEDPDYIRWVVEKADFSPDFIEICRQAGWGNILVASRLPPSSSVSPQAILWVIFVVALVGMLYVDLFQSRSEKAITLREAAFRSLEWILAALLYCGAIYWLLSPAKAAEFLTGYLIEKSLSVDNLFIFIMIFSYLTWTPLISRGC